MLPDLPKECLVENYPEDYFGFFSFEAEAYYTIENDKENYSMEDFQTMAGK